MKYPHYTYLDDIEILIYWIDPNTRRSRCADVLIDDWDDDVEEQTDTRFIDERIVPDSAVLLITGGTYEAR